ncbi:MAG: sulfotransferase [Verrucomicrobiota bacterium]
MNWLLALVTSAAFVEIFIRLGVLTRAQEVNRLSRRSIRTIGYKRASDHWKEKAVGAYAVRMMGASLLLGLGMVVAVLPFLVAGFATLNTTEPYLHFVSGLVGIVACTAFAIGYAMLRPSIFGSSETKAKASEGDYSGSSKMLHKLALNPAVAEMSFDLERKLHGRDAPDAARGRHVFVCGLARAGTTILMRELYATGEFGSLTYRDMPFVLAPNLWRGLWQKSAKKHASAARAHDDGLEHGFDSPEALEEVFWRIQAGGDYLEKDRLQPMDANEETVDALRAYIGVILKATGKPRYLSKNNNSILRLGSVAKAFPESRILVPYRDPRQHAFSLFKQHRHFQQMHQEDPFALQYMRWLAHHEFGADHRPFRFQPEEELPGNPESFDYWVTLWCQVYEHLLAHLPETARLVSYERLCGETELVWTALADDLILGNAPAPDNLRAAQVAETPELSDAVRVRAETCHQNLLNSPTNMGGPANLAATSA